MAELEEDNDTFEVLFEEEPIAAPEEAPQDTEEDETDEEEEEEEQATATAYAYQPARPLLSKDFQFLYTFTKRLLQYGVPVLFLVITAVLLLVSIEPMITFALVLSVGVGICVFAVLFDRSEGQGGKHGAMSVHLLALVATWYFWLLYSFGYFSTWEHAEPPLQDLSPLETLMYAVGYGVVLARGVSELPGLPFFLAWLLCLGLNILPVRENNLFLGAHAAAIGRMLMLVVIYCVLTYRHERFKLAPQPREARPRSFMQMQYVLFMPSALLAVLFFLVHMTVLLGQIKEEQRREEEARSERRRRRRAAAPVADPAPTPAPPVTSSAWATNPFETLIDPE